VDVYNNLFVNMNDNAFEADYDDTNIRVFRNLVVNGLEPLSVQPLYGGPAYFFRNVLFNVRNPLKQKRPGKAASNGAYFLHNTCIGIAAAISNYNDADIYNMFYRNNIIMSGPTAGIVIQYGGRTIMRDCSYDYNLYVGGGKSFAKWDKKPFKTLEAFQNANKQELHGIWLKTPDGLFANCKLPVSGFEAPHTLDHANVGLAEKSPARDKGEVLPNINNGFEGKAPDIGAYEYGQPIPHYGPRSDSTIHQSHPLQGKKTALR
jgi:hypothetical protein